jgi:hypothetical protein
MKMETEDYLHELAISRTKVARFKAEVKDLEKELNESELGVKLQEAKDGLKIMEAAQNGLVAGIKERIEVEFVRTGLENTKPFEGVQIKKFQQVRILDEKMAKAWAATNAPNVLSIKKAPFNKIAKALDGLEFVETYNEWRAQIASDLSMYEGELDE